MKRLTNPSYSASRDITAHMVLKGATLSLASIFLTAVCFAQPRSRGSSAEMIQLPAPKLTGPLSIEQVLKMRRTTRQFGSQPLSFVEISQLAWAGQGITELEKGLRTAPSAGALYPIELHFVTRDGVFVYHPESHSLEKTSDRDIRQRLSAAALKQTVVANAPCSIVITGSPKKLTSKYGSKARRFTFLEAGHIAQNIQLQAVSIDLVSTPVGAFDIKNVAQICRLSPRLEPLYIICVGYPQNYALNDQTQQQPNKTSTEDKNAIKKAVLIAPDRNFRDEELFETKNQLSSAGIITTVASSKTGILKGMYDGRVESTVLLNELNVDDYDAVIFIGGVGAKKYFEDQTVLDIARQARDNEKTLAAICIAPAILANAGVLDGVRATSFSSERIRLKKAGAQFTGTAVERDGLIITARDPKSAAGFGRTIADAITNPPQTE